MEKPPSTNRVASIDAEAPEVRLEIVTAVRGRSR